MDIEKIIEYLLIGNLLTQKIIYEMQNTNNLNIIYEVKQLFITYSMKHNIRQENTKIQSYYINISLDSIIMISKTNTNFSIEQNLELFEKIKINVPNLANYPLKTNNKKQKKTQKQNLESKITNIIFDYFQYINANKQVITEAYFKYKPKIILNQIHKNNNDNNNRKNIKLNKIHNLIKIENNKDKDIDKSSTREILKSRLYTNIIRTDKNNINNINNIIYTNNIKININNEKNLIDDDNNNNNNKNKLGLNQKEKDEEEDYTNVIKSIYKSHNLIKMFENENKNIIDNHRISTLNSMRVNKKMSKNKFLVFLIICIVILVQVISIPLIIINSYSN